MINDLLRGDCQAAPEAPGSPPRTATDIFSDVLSSLLQRLPGQA
jgi:hypothetical protein